MAKKTQATGEATEGTKQKRTRGPRVERLTAGELNRFAETVAVEYQRMRGDAEVTDEKLAEEWQLLEKIRRVRDAS